MIYLIKLKMIVINVHKSTNTRIAQEHNALPAIAAAVFSGLTAKENAYRSTMTNGSSHITLNIFISEKTSIGCIPPLRMLPSVGIAILPARQTKPSIAKSNR